MLLVAALTAVISVNGAVAALLPVVVVIAVRLRAIAVAAAHAARVRRPRGLDAHADRHAGERDRRRTPPQDYGGRPFGFFEFALVGVPLVVGAIAIVVLFGPRLLPNRTAPLDPADFSRARPDARGAVPPRRPMPARLVDRDASGLGRGRHPAALGAGRRGRVPGHGHRQRRPRGPRDPAQGRGPGARRDARSRSATRSCSRARGTPSTRTSRTRTCSWSTHPELVRRQAVPLGRGSRAAIAILVGMVVLLATGIVPSAVAGLLAASRAGPAPRASRTEGAYRAISWTTVVLVAGMIPLSTAMTRDRRRRPHRRHAGRGGRAGSGRTRCSPACSWSRRSSAS